MAIDEVIAYCVPLGNVLLGVSLIAAVIILAALIVASRG